MIDFHNFEIIKLPEQRVNIPISFVGIYPNDNGKPFFILPQGFENFDDEKLDIFFIDLYKTFKNYKNLLETKKKYNQDLKIHPDNQGTYTIENSENETTTFYSKLDYIDAIIDLVENQSFIDFNTKISPTKPFEIKSRHLEQAIYQNNIAIIDEVLDNKKYLTTQPSIDILNMLIFIYSQINIELKQGDKNSKYKNYYDSFIKKYNLTVSDRIVGKNSKQTLDKLKEIFEIIHKKTFYRDSVYYDIYDAIENFLYFNNIKNSRRMKWGIDSFSFVWEDMYLKYSFNHNKEQILFADTKRYANINIPFENGNNPYYIKNQDIESYPFYLKTPNVNKKYLYPDLVLLSLKEKEKITFDSFFTVIKRSYGSYTNHYIQLKSKYVANNYLQSVFKVDDIRTHEYTLVESGYIKRINDRYNGEWTKDLQKTKEDIIRYIVSLKNHVEKNHDFYEIFYDETLNITITDIKYYSKEFLELNNSKVINDSIKQLVYELALSQQEGYENYMIHSCFVIPKYFDNSNETNIEKEIAIVNPLIADKKIKILEVNFKMMMKNYIGELTQ